MGVLKDRRENGPEGMWLFGKVLTEHLQKFLESLEEKINHPRPVIVKVLHNNNKRKILKAKKD